MAHVKAFNSGVCQIYEIEKRSVGKELGRFNFREETIGIQAFTEFQTLGIEIEKTISIPYNTLATTGRVLKINDEDKYYQISLIQIKDTFPKSLRLTLSKSPLRWNDD